MLSFATGNSQSKNRTVFWSRLTGVAVFLFPLSFHSVDFRSAFSQGLSVSANKASPAYAAFEDLRESYDQPSFRFPEKAHTLESGVRFDFAASSLKNVTVRHLAMQGLTIRGPQMPVHRSDDKLNDEPIILASQVTSPIVRHEIATVPHSTSLLMQAVIGRSMSPREERMRLANELAQENWSTPSPASLAAQLVNDELANSGSIRNNPKLSRGLSVGPSMPISRNPNNATPRPRDDDRTPPPPPQNVAVNDPELNVSSILATRSMNPDNLRPLWLTGQVEMTEGLAFVGPETQMTVQRVFNGHVFEQGRIWVSEGRFEIRVREPVGYLVAELKTRDGRILGHGEINLIDLQPSSRRDDKVANLRIPLRPTTEGASLRAISGYSHGSHKMPVAEARIEIQAYSESQRPNADGIVSDPSLTRDSSFVARAQAKSSWPSVVIGQAREPQDIQIYSNALVQALINLSLNGSNASERKEAAHHGVVWGRLVQDGQPAASAQVEMAGDYKPIYFDEMYLPNPRLSATTANGLFAFVKVKRGVQALRVKVGGKTYPAQIFPTENAHVSYVELDLRARAVSQFRVFNAFNLQNPVSARIRLVGNDETLNVGKDDFVEYSVAANPFMVEADAGSDFEVTRVTVTGTPHVVHVPLVQREWLYNISLEKNIAVDGRRGAIVGFIDETGFEIELTGYAPGENMQIIYFDAQGKAVISKTGVVGGGFVIFNAPIGLQTLYVHESQSHQTFSQVVVAEPEFVSVVSHESVSHESVSHESVSHESVSH